MWPAHLNDWSYQPLESENWSVDPIRSTSNTLMNTRRRKLGGLNTLAWKCAGIFQDKRPPSLFSRLNQFLIRTACWLRMGRELLCSFTKFIIKERSVGILMISLLQWLTLSIIEAATNSLNQFMIDLLFWNIAEKLHFWEQVHVRSPKRIPTKLFLIEKEDWDHYLLPVAELVTKNLRVFSENRL